MKITDFSDFNLFCTGCGCCFAACPKSAITMVCNRQGFRYPSIDVNLCIDCGKCVGHCPAKKHMVLNDERFKYKAYLGYINDEEIRKRCASGGVFTALAINVLNKGGVVYGVSYINRCEVAHIRVGSIADLSKLQRSKYVQSQNTEYRKIKEDLASGRSVLFSGTPCQVAGLKCFLEKDYENLLCMDFECHGISNSRVLKKCLDYEETIRKKKIREYLMRYKKIYRHTYDTGYLMKFEDGSECFNRTQEDVFTNIFFRDIGLRDSCYDCRFKTQERYSDITVGDSWYAEIQTEGFLRDDYGVSKIITNTDKGDNAVLLGKNIIKCPVDIDKLIKTNGKMLYKSAVKPEKIVHDFWENWEAEDWRSLIPRIIEIKKTLKANKVLNYIIKSSKIWKAYRKRKRQKAFAKKLLNHRLIGLQKIKTKKQ